MARPVTEVTAELRLGLGGWKIADKEDALFVEALAASGSASPGPDNIMLDQLERLGALRSRGLLTEAEFQAAKRKLLGSEC